MTAGEYVIERLHAAVVEFTTAALAFQESGNLDVLVGRKALSAGMAQVVDAITVIHTGRLPDVATPSK